MSNTDCFIQQKAGINQVVLLPAHRPETRSARIWDGLLVLGFLGAFVGLVFLLAR